MELIDKIILDEPIIANLQERAKAISDKTQELIKVKKDLKAFAIYGKWGSGKTSICRTIYEQFRILGDNNSEDDSYYVPIWFDAWRYQHETEIYPALLQTIGEELIRLKCSESVKEKGTKLLDSSFKITRALLAGVKVKIPFVGDFSPKDVFNDIDSQKEYDHGIFNQIKNIENSPYFEAYNVLESIPNELKYKSKKFRILLFIDDLDRCLPDVAFNLIEQLKIWFDINGYTICLALNNNEIQKVVATHLMKHIKLDDSESLTMAHEYLLKVITLGIFINKNDIVSKIKKYLVADNEENLVEKLKEFLNVSANENVEFKIDQLLNNASEEELVNKINKFLKENSVDGKTFREEINIKNEIILEKMIRNKIERTGV